MSTLGETAPPPVPPPVPALRSTHAVDTRGRHTRSTHAIAERPTAVALAAADGVLGGTLQLVLHILGGEQRRPRAARCSAMMGRVVAPSALDDGTPIEQTTGLLQVLQACLDEHNQAIPDGPYVALCSLTKQIHQQLRLLKVELHSALCQRPPCARLYTPHEDSADGAWHAPRAYVPMINIRGRGVVPFPDLDG